MTEAKQVLTADFTFDDKPLQVDEIDGLMETVQAVAEHENKTLHRCENRVCDYDVYWNEKTNTVRIAAVVPGASYEVSEEAIK